MISTSADFDQYAKSGNTPRLNKPNSAPAKPANTPASANAATW